MQNAIRDAAYEDQEELLERIKNSIGAEDQRDDDHIRGVYLKSRLNNAEVDVQNIQELKAYTISRDLGSGASGMVLQVRWLGQELALKVLKVIDRTEATVLGRLQHPNIVRLFHYWEEITPEGPRSCIIMELMPRDLQKHIGNVLRKLSSLPLKLKKGGTSIMPFSLSVAIDTMLQVAEAMRKLHEKKLTHRDLKTSNILVKPVDEGYLALHSEGYLEVKLADFGTAKAYANSSISGDLTRFMGTTVYGAPEVFEKEKVLRERNFPPKADVWSFGMTCSEILTGKVPFADDSFRPTLHTRIRKNGLRPSLPKECPEYLRFCIESCWVLHPQRRPSFSDLCRMLRHAKFLSLGLMDLENNKCLFSYQTSAGVTKSGVNSLLRQEDAKKSRFGFDTIWHNLRGVEGSVKVWQPSTSDSLRLQSRTDLLSKKFNYKSNKQMRKTKRNPALRVGGAIAFRFEELAHATNNFSDENQIGQGGYGKVYLGNINGGEKQVAIKRAEEGSLQGAHEFFTEIELLSRVHHRNLVMLEGYCDDEGEQMLVYEFIPGGCLREHLCDISNTPLDFPTRLRIALGSARGILYLHTEANPPILHRDIKSRNILLDNRKVAKVADFGLSRLAPMLDAEGDTPGHVSTVVKGTPGYIDPEYFLTHQLTDKSDVYGFGVVLLELLTGMHAISEGKNIVREVHQRSLGGQGLSIVDPHIAHFPAEVLERFMALALSCCLDMPEPRPSMSEVVRDLEGLGWMIANTFPSGYSNDNMGTSLSSLHIG